MRGDKTLTDSTTATVTYTNRKGDTYYLGASPTKGGKRRFVFARQPSGEPVAELPSGYEIRENVHGQVSLGKITASAISDLELRQVMAALNAHPHLARCRVEVKGKSVIVYEAHNGVTEAMGDWEKCGLGVPTPGAMKSVERWTRYIPVLRFNIIDAEARTFAAERMCFRGSMEGWLSLHAIDRLGDLAICRGW